jgi:hypothetical protein
MMALCRNMTGWFQQAGYAAALCGIVILTGCSASTGLSHLSVDQTAGSSFRYIYLDIDLPDNADTLSLTSAMIRELGRYDLKILQSTQQREQSSSDHSASALLTIRKIERRLEPAEHRKRYGRMSLTQMRGRKKYEKPIITLRARLVDNESGLMVFQADYIAEGPWYADSATIVASLARTFSMQLEQWQLISIESS